MKLKKFVAGLMTGVVVALVVTHCASCAQQPVNQTVIRNGDYILLIGDDDSLKVYHILDTAIWVK